MGAGIREGNRLTEADKSMQWDREEECGPVLPVVEPPAKVISPIRACAMRQLLTCPSE